MKPQSTQKKKGKDKHDANEEKKQVILCDLCGYV